MVITINIIEKSLRKLKKKDRMVKNMKKIIISEKFKEHMEVHKKEFISPYDTLIDKFEKSKEFQKIDEDFTQIEFNFGQAVGFKMLVDTTEQDGIIYAKRIGRDTYTRFVKTKEYYYKTSNVVFILSRNKNCKDEFYMITMFPGNRSEKEPTDKNIKNKEELEKSLKFWKDKALIFDKSIVQQNTIIYECPYSNLLTNCN